MCTIISFNSIPTTLAAYHQLSLIVVKATPVSAKATLGRCMKCVCPKCNQQVNIKYKLHHCTFRQVSSTLYLTKICWYSVKTGTRTLDIWQCSSYSLTDQTCYIFLAVIVKCKLDCLFCQCMQVWSSEPKCLTSNQVLLTERTSKHSFIISLWGKTNYKSNNELRKQGNKGRNGYRH